ncbi:MAG: 3'-5' exonuclease, partial [Pirellula staleyi]
NAIERFLEQVTLLSDADGITDTDSKVTLMTLHSAKGLEFDNVFIIAVEQEVLPHIRSMRDPAQLEEERRLFFVGITRARNRLQISTARTRGFGNSKMSCPSSFLLELPRAEMEIIDRSEPFGFGDDFAADDHGNSYQEDWEAKSFLHRGKRANIPAPKRKQPAIEPKEEWEGSQEPPGGVVDENADDNDVVFQDFSLRVFSDEETPMGLDDISKKLDRLNKQLPRGGLKTAAQITVTTTPDGIPVDRFEEGDIVMHPTYGQGTISSVEGRGMRRMARVTFQEGDSKSFQLSKSKLSYP